MANWFSKKLNGLSLEKEKAANTATEVKTCGVCDSAFAEVMTVNLYTRVIHKCFSRAILPTDVDKAAFNMTIYDSYSPYKRGLASIITLALTGKKQVFIKLSKTDNDVVLFTPLDGNASDEEKQASDVIELDFREFVQVDIVNLLFCLIQGVLTAIDKGVTVSQALLFQLHGLHEMIANDSSDKVLKEQLVQLNTALTQGNTGYVDAKSAVTFPTYDAAPAQKGIDLLYGILANVTGLPRSFIDSETVGGLGSTASSDNQRLNDAVEYYYYNVVNNILYSVYSRVFEFKQYVADVNAMISAFAFVETTTLLTDAGKLKFMINNTGFNEDDINIVVGTEIVPNKPTVKVNENIDS